MRKMISFTYYNLIVRFVLQSLLFCTDVTSEDSGHIGCRLSVDNERLSNFSEFLVAGRHGF